MFTLLLCTLLAGCASVDPADQLYQDSMQKGMEALSNQHYEMAVQYFGEAKKAKPTAEADDYLNKAIKQYEDVGDIKSNLDNARMAMDQQDYGTAVNLLRTNSDKKNRVGQAAEWVEQSASILADAEVLWRDSLIGEWGQVPTSYEAYHYVKIQDLSANRMRVELISTQSPPASRYASIAVEAEYSSGMISFVYDDDGWGNKGSGTIRMIKKDELEVSIGESYSNPEANWSLKSSASWPRITDEMKQLAASKDAEKEQEIAREQKRIADAKRTITRDSLTFQITDILYSKPLNSSQIYYTVTNDPNVDYMAYAAWAIYFMDQNGDPMTRSVGGGGTNALMPGEKSKGNFFVEGDVRKYSSITIAPVSEGTYPIVDPLQFER